MFEATVDKKANTLTLVLPLAQKGTTSASGKNSIIASTFGNHPVIVDGKIITVGANAWEKIPKT